MSRIAFVTVLVVVVYECTCAIPPESNPDAGELKPGNETKPVILDVNVITNGTVIANGTVNALVPKEKEPPRNRTHEITVVQPEIRALNEPALHRLFYVLLGLSTVTVCYVALKMYRVRKGVARPTHVRKYGVLTQRSDIEMEPLHLDDDEDDDTVFDVGAHANR